MGRDEHSVLGWRSSLLSGRAVVPSRRVCAMSPCRWHRDAARAEVLWEEEVPSRHGQRGQGCGAGVPVVTATCGACQGAQRCRSPSRAAPAPPGSACVGDRVLSRGSAVAPPLPAEPVSFCPAGQQCRGHGAGHAGGQCTTGARGDRHGGCFWVAATGLNICHVPALITVIGCWRALLAPALAPRGSMTGSGVRCSTREGVPVPTSPFVPSPEACPHVPVGTQPMRGACTCGRVPLSNPKSFGGCSSRLGGGSHTQPQAESGPGGDAPELLRRLKGALDHEAPAPGWAWYASNAGNPAGRVAPPAQVGQAGPWLIPGGQGLQ